MRPRVTSPGYEDWASNGMIPKTRAVESKPKRIPVKRKEPRRSERVLDEEYLIAVRGLPCLFRTRGIDSSPCSGAPRNDGWRGWFEIEADHAGPHPHGRKADDVTAIPLCPGHHDQRTDAKGYFRGYDDERMRAWCDEAISETQARLKSHGARRGG